MKVQWPSFIELKKKVKLLTLTAATLPLSISSYADDLTIAFGVDKPPFVYGKEDRGLEIDIVKTILENKGHTLKIKHFANSRLQDAINLHGVDGAASVRKADDDFFYSDNFITYENFVISKKKNNLSINKVSDLKGVNLLAWQNAYRDLGPEFEALFKPGSPDRGGYEEISSQLAQNKRFWRDRADAIVIDKTIFQYYRKNLSKNFDTSDEVVYHALFPKLTHFQVSFAKENVRDDFNAGLAEIRSSGQYQELVNKYIK